MKLDLFFIENSMGLRYSIDKSKNFLYLDLKFCLFPFSGWAFFSVSTR